LILLQIGFGIFFFVTASFPPEEVDAARVTIFLAVEEELFVVRRKVAVNAIAAAIGKIGFIVIVD
jgi:hypothetical protein